MNRFTLISILIAAGIIWSAFAFSKVPTTSETIPENNVSNIDDVQIVDIRAKGGYYPQRSTAKAGVPTILRVTTNGSFDCSTIVRIPSINLTKNLPPTGSLDIDLGTPKAGLFQGTCGMGMYSFQIDFQ